MAGNMTDLASRAAASSQKIEEIFDTIPDKGLRDDVAKIVRLSFEALGNLRRVHLPQDEFEEGDTVRSEDEQHLDLAPYVLASVSTVNKLLSFSAKAFPAPAQSEEQDDDDFDLEFDLVDGPIGQGLGLSGRSQPETSFTPREQVADSIHAFAGMLRSRVLDFAGRLKFALRQNDSWPLLAELDDGKRRMTKAVQAVLFGVLGVFVSDVRRESILPAYRSAVDESVVLRAAVAELTYHINRFNLALADATPEIAVPLVVAVSDRLARFCARPEYRTLRAEDKKAVIDFRATLFSLRHRKEGLPMLPLRHAVEGFSKFLEAMSAINHREVLVLHDRQRLQTLLAHINGVLTSTDLHDDQASTELGELVGQLEAVVGRNPDVDQARRDYIAKPTSAKMAIDALSKWKGMLEMALATV
jgi:hypothetical protein